MKIKRDCLTKDEIVKKIMDNSDKLYTFKVKRIGLFGSYVKNKQTLKSDIDVYVEFEEPSFDNFIGLVQFLEKLFKKKVDVITPAGLESIRIKHIKESIKKNLIYV